MTGATRSEHNGANALLLVDDDPDVLETLVDIFETDYRVHSARNGHEAVELVRLHGEIAVVVMDIRMAAMDGIEAARAIHTLRKDIPVIFHTGYPGDYNEDELDATERPFDFVQKGRNITRLIRSVKNAVENYALRKDSASLKVFAESQIGMIGQSAAMQEAYTLIRKVAPTECKILIRGETGTGKELVARAIHRLSPRSEKRQAVFNCNHKSPDLVESELFGHLKGSFTGAVANRIGIFEYADGGTVFLDEIGDLDITTQAKLLRVLETGEYQTIGSPDTKRVDIRLLAATHKPLEEMVNKGLFREDLYYRLKGVQIKLPPLRERREDISVLIGRFVDRLTIEQDLPPKIFDPQALAIMTNYGWPGNVRQLLDTVETLLITTDSDIVLACQVAHVLGLESAGSSSEPPTTTLGLIPQVEAFRRSLIEDALSKSSGNVAEAARVLQVDRANLSKWIRAHKINGE